MQQIIWKCLNCGAIMLKGAPANCIDATFLSQFAFKSFSKHECDENQIGIATIVGVEKVVEKGGDKHG